MFKFILVISLAVSLCGISHGLAAQDSKCDSIYTLAEQMPYFGKGQKEFSEYLNKNLTVKKPCKAADLKRIIFIVNKDGKISDIEMIGVNGKCKEDLINQFKTFPDWTPGKDQGQFVCVRVVLPIQLKVRKKDEAEEPQ